MDVRDVLSLLPRPVRLMGGWGLVRRVRGGDGSPVRVLQVGGVYQSATYLEPARRMEPVFSYYRAFDHVFSVRPDTRRVLMVGGGGYAWPKHVLATRSAGVTLDVVELDPAVTRAARRWFFLDEARDRWPGRLRLIEGDGRAFLEGRALRIAGGAGDRASDGGDGGFGDGVTARAAGGPAGGPAFGATVGVSTSDSVSGATAGSDGGPGDELRYDAIVLDAFAGAEPVRSLATVEAARAARDCLVPDGVLAANVVSAGGGGDLSFLRDVVATFREAFARVSVVLCDEDPFAAEDNYLVLATNGAWVVPDALPYDEGFPGEALRD